MHIQHSSIQVVGRHQEFQAQLRRDIHIRHIGLVLVLLVVKEVFADFLENDTTAKASTLAVIEDEARSNAGSTESPSGIRTSRSQVHSGQ